MLIRFTIILFLFPFTATADIRNIQITNDTSSSILLEKFGFSNSGHLSITLESATFSSIHDPSRLGFCIISSTAYPPYNPYNRSEPCLLDRDGTRILFNFTQLIPPYNSFNLSHQTKSSDKYALYFANCELDSPVTMSITTGMYNLDSNGHKNYLPEGETQLPVLYSFYAAVYVLLLLIWVCICVFGDRKTHLATHLLVAGLFGLKALSLICAAVATQYTKVTGTSHGWDSVFHSLLCCRLIWLCVALALIGYGWSVSRPLYQQLTMLISWMNVLALHGYTVGMEASLITYEWRYSLYIFLLVQIALMSVLCVFQIFWYWRLAQKATQTQTGNAPNTRDSEGNASTTNAKKENEESGENGVYCHESFFIHIYLVPMLYLWTGMSALVFRLKADFSDTACKNEWVTTAIQEIITLTIYAMLCYMFRRSVQKNTFFVVDSREHFISLVKFLRRCRLLDSRES